MYVYVTRDFDMGLRGGLDDRWREGERRKGSNRVGQGGKGENSKLEFRYGINSSFTHANHEQTGRSHGIWVPGYQREPSRAARDQCRGHEHR